MLERPQCGMPEDAALVFDGLMYTHDHQQPTRYGGREAMFWISQGSPASYQLNGLNKNNSTKGYSEAELLDAGVYGVSSSGNGYGTDIFDTLGNYKKISQGKLYKSVLPKYIQLMQDRAHDY